MSDIRADAEHVAKCDDLWTHGADESDLFDAVRRGQRVAAAWLKDHPADDGEWTTEEWLLSVGLPAPVPGLGISLSDLVSIWNTSCGWHAFYHNGEGDAYMPDIDTNGPKMIANANTRGRLRRLCAAFGVKLKEKS